MGKAIIMHIDDAPWIRGEPRKPGGPATNGGQLVGDIRTGPWIHVESLPANLAVPPHSHSQDETMYIVEGQISLGARKCGPGTVVWVEKDTQYGFKVGPEGVRFLNIRRGLATITMGGVTTDPYIGVRR